ncbi:MAG: hypothetical protein ACJATA_000850 [Sphingobacteriales bacterium]|jgi:hypothetical protein
MRWLNYFHEKDSKVLKPCYHEKYFYNVLNPNNWVTLYHVRKLF